jgi:hypothetical protein
MTMQTYIRDILTGVTTEVPDGSEIVFGPRGDSRIVVRAKDGGIEVDGDRALTVDPVVANRLQIFSGRR